MKAATAHFSASGSYYSDHHRTAVFVAAHRVARLLFAALLVVVFLSAPSAPSLVHGYTHEPCTRAQRAQFQFPDCYLPPLNEELLLSEASFLLSHNAATGYISRNSLSKTGLSWRYSQNQVGSVYQQLRDGARALDVRPLLLRNGTVLMQHGAIRIPVTLQELMRDAQRWCQENPEELVLVLPSHFAYETAAAYTFRTNKNDDTITDDDGAYFDYQDGESYNDNEDDNADDGDQQSVTDMVSSIASVLNGLGISYYECSDVYQLTVAETMELASLGNNKGYLLVLDSHDYYGTSCGKENWIESQAVTCYPNNNTLPCTKSDQPWYNLRDYMLASANNAATDSSSTLGPPANLYNKPFNEIQALWQVDTAAAVAGMAHLSSILQDNQQSRLNERVLNLVYNGAFNAVSLLAVDNVARNGNALTSVLRNQCGQQHQQSNGNSDDPLPCGSQLEPPRIKYWHISGQQWSGTILVLYGVWFAYSVVVLKKPKSLNTAYARCREWHSRHDDRKEELLDNES